MDFIHYQSLLDDYMSEESDEGTEVIALEFGNIETILDFDAMQQREEVQMTDAVEEITKEIQIMSLNQTKAYKKYGQDQIEIFIRIRQEQGHSVPKAAALCSMPRSSAYELINEFNASNGTVLPGNNPRKTTNKAKKLFPEHTEFVIDLFDKCPSSVLEEVTIKLCEAFPGFEISIGGLYKHTREKCALSLKQATKYTAERNSPRILQLHFNIITQWKAAGANFRENCVFVDEAGFHTQMIRSRAWSKKKEIQQSLKYIGRRM